MSVERYRRLFNLRYIEGELYVEFSDQIRFISPMLYDYRVETPLLTFLHAKIIGFNVLWATSLIYDTTFKIEVRLIYSFIVIV